MTQAYSAPNANFRAFDSTGKPLAGGFLYTYAAGTTTPLATYTDETGATANTNPVVLDSTGTANVWLGPNPYKFALQDANNVPQWTVDNLTGVPTVSSAMLPILAESTTAAALAALGGVTLAQVEALISAALNPTGSLTPFTGTVYPSGYVEANGQYLSRTTYANLWTFAQASGNISSTDTTVAASGTIINPGAGYVAGTYTSVPFTGGTGTGFTATVVVASGGYVSSITTDSTDTGMRVGDTLTTANSHLGGTGSGLALQIQTVTGWDIGMYSPGNGSTTFRVPDLRGYLLRAWDDSLGVDAGRNFGTSQADLVGAHNHPLTDPGHLHAVGVNDASSGGSYANGSSDDGGHELINTQTSTTGITIAYNTGVETRPKNVAYPILIKT